MTQIATKSVPQDLPKLCEEGGNDTNSDEIFALALPQTCKEGGNDTNSNKIIPKTPSRYAERAGMIQIAAKIIAHALPQA
jgi:hypothetical protein